MRPPLVLFVHGGGWSVGDRSRVQGKPEFFDEQGFMFGSIGYRVLPDAPVEDQAHDVAAGIALVRAYAGRFGFDPDRIVLMGHSAGAHLAALVATDPAYLGDAFDAISGVILLDGAAYDLRADAFESAPMPRIYRHAFGRDPQRHAHLSPIVHAGAQDASSWLILHVAQRQRSGEDSRALGAALEAEGANVEVHAISGTNHGGMNRDIGKPGDATSAAIAEFLAQLFD